MIISPRHRYVYVQVPQTGSTATGRFLVAHADGTSVLRKHTTLDEARWIYGDRIRDFLVMASVRDPVDQLVSSFSKLMATAAITPQTSPPDPSYGERLRWALDAPRTLDDYIGRFVRHVHAPGWVPSARAADIVVRFEDLGRGVAELFDRIGVAQPHEVPHENETPLRNEQGPGSDALRRLQDLYGPFGHEFGYPIGGEPARSGPLRRVEYEAIIRAKVWRRRRRNLDLLRAKDAADPVEFDAPGARPPGS